MRRGASAAAGVLLAVLAAGCSRYETTAEEPLPVASRARVTMLQVHETRPVVGSLGLRHHVICRSRNAGDWLRREHPAIPRNTSHVAEIDVPPSATANAGELARALDVARTALASGDGWIAWKAGALRITFDECGTWHDFAPWDAIPSGQVAGCDSATCARAALLRSGIEYAGLKIVPGGRGDRGIAFTLRSRALLGDWKVSSTDDGASWTLTDPQGVRLRPASDAAAASGTVLAAIPDKGAVFAAVCRSPATRGRDVRIERIDNMTWHADSAADRLKEANEIVRLATRSGPGWIAFAWRALHLTFDGCSTFHTFDAAKELAGHVPCTGNSCAYHALYLTNPLAYEDLRVETPPGAAPRISFVVRSRALAGNGARRVASQDGGATWSIASEGSAGRVDPARIRTRDLATTGEMTFTLVEVRPLPRPGLRTLPDTFVVCRAPGARASREELERGVPPDATLAGELVYNGWGPEPPAGVDRLEWWVPRAQKALETGPGWAAWRRDTLRVTLDGCAAWREFVPWTAIPFAEMRMHDSPGSRRCPDRGCAQAVLSNFNYADFAALEVDTRRGTVGFEMRHDKLEGGTRRVASADGGATWTVRAP